MRLFFAREVDHARDEGIVVQVGVVVDGDAVLAQRAQIDGVLAAPSPNARRAERPTGRIDRAHVPKVNAQAAIGRHAHFPPLALIGVVRRSP